MKELIIIGGGPAGAAAAVYAARKKMNSMIIAEEFGGQSSVSTDIQNWIGTKSITGQELAEKLKEHVYEYANDSLDVIEKDCVVNIKEGEDGFTLETKKGDVHKTKTVLVVTGSRRRKLDVPGAERLDNKGISYCATCDAPMFSGMNVVVVGGGNSGFESAQQLLSYATKVTLLHRREEFKAEASTVDSVEKDEKFEAIRNTDIQEIKGENFVNSVVYKDKTTDKVYEIEAGGVFVEIGSIPNSGFVKDMVKTNEIGEIIVDHKTQRTSREGIWAAGDVSNVLYKQNNISAGDAVKALEDIYGYIQKKKNPGAGIVWGRELEQTV